MENNSWEQTLQDGKLYRHLNSLIVAHLRDSNLTQAASAVASATMTPLNVEAPPNKLLELVAKGLAVEKDDVFKGTLSSPFRDLGAPVLPSHPGATVIDFSAVPDIKGASKSFPKHETRHLSEHKNIARCARFSPDGKFVATGSADTSIKLFEVSKIKQMLLPDAKDGPVRPVIRTFYDHTQPINDLDFHPQGTILVSGAKDQTMKFFDISKTNAKRAYRVIQDTHNVRSVSFHPSGDFLLAGTDHAIPHLYDINTFQCYLSANIPEVGPNGAINQVRYSCTGAMYVTASKDGVIRLWDGITANCVRSITGAHGTAEATSAIFTKDERFVLSCGKDSTIKLWEVGSGRLVKQYLGAMHTQLRCQSSLNVVPELKIAPNLSLNLTTVVLEIFSGDGIMTWLDGGHAESYAALAIFNETEEFILSIDELNNEIVIWDAMTTEKVAKWPSNHVGAPRWIDHSPTESAFISCGTDRSVRFWKETI